jgi:transcriptional regulator with XRE-family HTH domain
MKKQQNNIISDWLKKNSNPEIDKFIERNTAISEKIYSILEERGLKSSDLAKLLGKSPSEISKWLSGMHNVTLKSITKIETVLGVDLIHIEPQYVYLRYRVKEDSQLEEELAFEPSTYTKDAVGFY